MTTRGTADIVFCLDASSSMTPCFEGVRGHISSFVDGLGPGGQAAWDLRFDFVAYRDTRGSFPLEPFRSVNSDDLARDLYASNGPSSGLFVKEVAVFRHGLERLNVSGDEASLVGLDFALDFPWRDPRACRRVVVLLTDEPFESGTLQDAQRRVLPDLMSKIEDLRVLLFMVTPPSALYSELAEVDRSEHIEVSSGDGLATVDFHVLLEQLGKSVSASTLQASAPKAVRRALFGQDRWAL